MTNSEMIMALLDDAVNQIKSGDMAPLLLKAARSERLNPGGDLYALWCDGCGNCLTCCEEEGADEEILSCIRRFLNRECL